MDTQFQEIREQQKATWNKFSGGWKKWDALTMDFLQPMGEEIIRLIHPQDSQVVLDIASGTGEPGLSIASMLPTGKVVLTDLSEDMLSVARENAALRGITNIETRVCDVCELPFHTDFFDAVTCRFGFMFFPDMMLAAQEMVRVLKPGGKMATAVWNIPEKNFWVTAIMDAIRKNMDIPAPPPGAPGMFRCAEEGMMKRLLAQAGLKNMAEVEVISTLKSGSAETYWQMMTDVSAPVVSAMSKADDATKTRIREDVFAALHTKYPDGNVVVEASAIVIYGEKG